MSDNNAPMLLEIYKELGVTNQLDALNAIADLKTINSSMEAEIHTILNIDFGIQGYYLKDKCTSEKLKILSIIGKRLQKVTDISKIPELVSIEDLPKWVADIKVLVLLELGLFKKLLPNSNVVVKLLLLNKP